MSEESYRAMPFQCWMADCFDHEPHHHSQAALRNRIEALEAELEKVKWGPSQSPTILGLVWRADAAEARVKELEAILCDLDSVYRKECAENARLLAIVSEVLEVAEDLDHFIHEERGVGKYEVDGRISKLRAALTPEPRADHRGDSTGMVKDSAGRWHYPACHHKDDHLKDSNAPRCRCACFCPQPRAAR